jgi:acetoin utilization protein AcuC
MEKELPNILIYSDKLAAAEYGPSHPFKPVRARLFLELLNRYYHLHTDHFRVEEPHPLPEELLYLFHTKSYIDLLRRAEQGEFDVRMLEAGLGTADNPVFRGVFDLALLIAGGTYQGAMMLCDGAAATVFDPISGLHHARQDHAEGFCYINDIAIAIAAAARRGFRIAYVDFDAHHGDGVQEAFYTTDQVLTISLHESGTTLFPGTGFETEIGSEKGRGYNVNIPFSAGTDDEVYLYAFNAVVPPLLEAFRPDIVFAQVGGDGHKDDRLAHLNLTSTGYRKAITEVRRLSPRIMAMGGGGYNLYKTAALWTLAWSALVGTEPEDKFTGLIGGMMYGPEADAGSLEDLPYMVEGQEKEQCFSEAERVVRFIKDHIFPIHGL